MVPLDSPRWSTLSHAYGSASDIPALLRSVAADLTRSWGSPTEISWFDLWSALYHQGDIYSASLAAVPHLVETLSQDPIHACCDFFMMPASIEVTRNRKNTPIPPDFADAYFASLKRIPLVAGHALARPWDETLCCTVLAAIAASKGHIDTAEMLLEVDAQATPELLQWYFSRRWSETGDRGAIESKWSWILSHESEDIRQIASEAARYPNLRSLYPYASVGKILSFSHAVTYPYDWLPYILTNSWAGYFEVRDFDNHPLGRGGLADMVRLLSDAVAKHEARASSNRWRGP